MGDDTLHGVPVGRDVSGNAPGRTYIVYPCARKVPAAYVDTHIFSSCVVNSLSDGSIALLFVKVEMFCVLRCITATEINLNKIKLQVLEKEIGILLVMSIKAYTASHFVFVPEVSAGVASCI